MVRRFVIASVLALAAQQTQASDIPAPADLHDGIKVATPAAAGLDPTPLAGLPVAIAHGDYPKTTSVLVVRKGTLAYEGYFGEGSVDLLNNTRSATKFFTALAVGDAIRDHALPSEQAQAFAYLSDLKPFRNDTPEKEAITLQDMMTMSSALDCNDNDDASPGNEDRMHEQQNWTRWAVDLPTMKGYARDASGLGPWRYCTVNAVLTGQAVQRATHTPIDRYIEDSVMKPLGIAKWNWSYSPAHETMAGGGLELRARDLAKVAWMLVDAGRWNGKQIVPQSWIEAAFTVRRPANDGQGYGYFIFENALKTNCGLTPAWYMAGNGGSQIVMLRDLQAAVVVTRTAYNVHGTAAQTKDLLTRYVLPALPCGARKS